MPVYIAKEYNGKVADVVMAKSRELAVAYWQGKGLFPHTTMKLTEANVQNHITGVLSIVRTRKETLSPLGLNAREYLVIDD